MKLENNFYFPIEIKVKHQQCWIYKLRIHTKIKWNGCLDFSHIQLNLIEIEVFGARILTFEAAHNFYSYYILFVVFEPSQKKSFFLLLSFKSIKKTTTTTVEPRTKHECYTWTLIFILFNSRVSIHYSNIPLFQAKWKQRSFCFLFLCTLFTFI